MSQSNGIMELMQAEQRASVIVAEARVGRGDRMKQAKAEAEVVISGYMSQKENEFNSSTSNIAQAVNPAILKNETSLEISKTNQQYTRNQNAALKMLLAKCCEVSLDVPAARVRSAQKARDVEGGRR